MCIIVCAYVHKGTTNHTHRFLQLDLVDLDAPHAVFEVSIESKLVTVLHLLHLGMLSQHSSLPQ